jgi:hypothetical protein
MRHEAAQEMRDLSWERESFCHLVAATKVETKRLLKTVFQEIESIGVIIRG